MVRFVFSYYGTMTPPAVTASDRASERIDTMPSDAPTQAYTRAEMVGISRDATAPARATSSDRNESCCCKCSCVRASDGEVKKTFCGASAEPSLVSSVAALLQQLAAQNKSEGCGAPCFLSATEPVISVPDYLERLARFFQCSRECFVLALIYIDRLLQANRHIWLCPLNVHRLVVTALMVAVKFADDTFYSNAYYAKVGGLPLREINHLEATFLRMLQFRLHVLPWEFQKFLKLVVESPFSSSSGRPRALCGNSNGLCVPTPAAGDSDRMRGDFTNSSKMLHHSGNTFGSPSSGSTAYFSGSSQSVSPPLSPEAFCEPKSPPDEVIPGLNVHRQGRYGAVAAMNLLQQQGRRRGNSSNSCQEERLKRPVDGLYHSRVQVGQQIQQALFSQPCYRARAAEDLTHHFRSSPSEKPHCSAMRQHPGCLPVISVQAAGQEEAAMSQ